MKEILLQPEDYHSLIDNYQNNKDRIQLYHKEIASWEYHLGGLKAVQFDREPSTSCRVKGLSPIQNESLYKIEQCYNDIKVCQRKMEIVDRFLNYLQMAGDEVEYKIIYMRTLERKWEDISNEVQYSYSNCRYLYLKSIENYIRFIRQLS